MKPPYLLRTDGTEVALRPKGKKFTLEEWYDALRTSDNLNPTVQMVPLSADLFLICEEDGIALDLPTNETATLRFALSGIATGPKGMLGNILIIPKSLMD